MYILSLERNFESSFSSSDFYTQESVSNHITDIFSYYVFVAKILE